MCNKLQCSKNLLYNAFIHNCTKCIYKYINYLIMIWTIREAFIVIMLWDLFTRNGQLCCFLVLTYSLQKVLFCFIEHCLLSVNHDL